LLKHFNKIEKEAQQFIHERIVEQYDKKYSQGVRGARYDFFKTLK